MIEVALEGRLEILQIKARSVLQEFYFKNLLNFGMIANQQGGYYNEAIVQQSYSVKKFFREE